MSVLGDTNVVSELIRKAPDPAVEAWAAGHAPEDLFFSAAGEAELRYGAAILPAGRRRNELEAAMLRWLNVGFSLKAGLSESFLPTGLRAEDAG